MQEDCKEGFIKESALRKESFETTEHHAILKEIGTRGYACKDARNEHLERNPDIIAGDAQKHV